MLLRSPFQMATVLQLSRRLDARPESVLLPDVNVRNYAGDGDIAPWLELRHRTFARQRVGVREWSENDFRGEFLDRWWWQPELMWLAETASPATRSETRQVIGAVTLAMRGERDRAKPVVHWLLVEPKWRRRGIGRLLMAKLERVAWDAGFREVFLETHSAWQAAAKFYEALGYRSI